MASSCNLGAANVKLAKLDSGRVRFCSLQQRNTARIWIGQRPLQYAGLAIAHQSERTLNICRASETVSVKDIAIASKDTESSSLKSQLIPNASEVESLVTDIAIASKDTESSSLKSQLIPNASEVESLVTDICDTTLIAEFDLKLGGFRLRVKRNVSAKTSQIPPPPPPQPATPVPTTTITKVEATGSNGAVSSTSLVAITKPSYATGGVESFLERATDEGLMILTSPRVGFFRRSRAIKGKRGPPSCKENQIVKEGQVLCYIEQFGGEIPIESDIAGEIVRILRKDGEPVGYGDALLAVLPSFPGIKKLQ